MNLTTKKVIEKAIRARKQNLVRLEHLDADCGALLIEDKIVSTKKQIDELKEDLQKLFNLC